MRCMMALMEHRGVVEEVSWAQMPEYGTVNLLMMMPAHSFDEHGMLKLDKVDAVLNAKPCNAWVQINKEATDYMKAYMPFVGECQDMGVVLERLRT
jgi:hypothetical protein